MSLVDERPAGVEPVVPTALEPTHPRVTAVIPTRNEARNLPHVLRALPALVDEVVIVDGRSTDGTVDVARRLRPDAIIDQQPGRGKGDALAHGFGLATGDIVVMLDADGSTDPAEIPRFVEALLGGADMAKGSRFRPGGGSVDLTAVRSLGNRALTALVNRVHRTSFTDLCYGYNAFWRDSLAAIDVDCPGFEVETLINIRAARARLTIAEVPSMELERIHGASNLHAVRDGLRVLQTIARERRAGTAPARQPDLSLLVAVD